MTDGTARELTVDMSFLGKGRYSADIFQDGPNAQRYAEGPSSAADRPETAVSCRPASGLPDPDTLSMI